MKTKQIKIYSFSELSDEAKQNAIGQWRSSEDFSWIVDEAGSSLDRFCSIFSVNYRQIDYQETYRNEYKIDLEDNVLELSGVRLATYIWNNYKNQIFKGSYYGKLVDTFPNGEKIPVSKEHPIGQRHVLRHSKCQLDNCCVLTGVCYDDDVLNPIYKFLDKPTSSTFQELIDDCILSLCKSVSSEIEANLQDDTIQETIEANDYEFLENGVFA